MSLPMFSTLSPSAGPSRSTSSMSMSPPPPPPPAIGKKTSLFFSTPFASSPTPPPPPSPSMHARHASETYQPLTAHPTPPPSVYADDASDWGSPASSPGVQLARLRSLRAASRARRDEEASELRRATSLRTRAFVDVHAAPISSEDSVVVESPTSPNGLGLSALGFVVPAVTQSASALVQHPTLPTDTSKPPPSPTSPTKPTPRRPATGDVLEPSSGARFVLVKTLGRGAFSSVWLARDESEPSGDERRKSECAAPRKGEHVQGLRPTEHKDSLLLSATSAPYTEEGSLVAVKMIDRALCDANDRTRVAFVREVEVLRHISHPSIISYRHAFSTPTAHCLVLSYATGGELFDVVSDDQKWERFRSYRLDSFELSEGDGTLLRRIFGELVAAVAWMHSVDVVHRDIKLENILLSQNLPSRGSVLPPHGTPIVKLADFGLARFIDPAHPRLSTRCGSEAYAAPELLLGGGARSHGKSDDFDAEDGHMPTRAHTAESSTSGSTDESSGPGTPPALWGLSDQHRMYTGSSVGGSDMTKTPPRVLLEPATPNFAPIAALPVETPKPVAAPSPAAPTEGGYDPRLTDAWALGVVLYALTTRALPFGAAESARDRRRAAAAHYEWDEGELTGWWDTNCINGARGIVARLLVRDQHERADIGAVLDDTWLR